MSDSASMKRVYQAFSATKVPGTYYQWPTGKAPELPFFIYHTENGGEFYADNRVFYGAPKYVVDLYEQPVDWDRQEQFEEAAAAIGPFTKYGPDWIADENCFVTSFEFQTSKEENNG